MINFDTGNPLLFWQVIPDGIHLILNEVWKENRMKPFPCNFAVQQGNI